MMLRTETFRQLGGFDSRYFMYAEDMDLCFKVRRSGLKIHHVPQAEIVHHGGCSSRTQFSKFSVVMICEAIHFYLLSNLGCLQAGLYRSLMALAALLRMLVLVMTWLSASKETRVARRVAILKWWTVLRWSLGLEGWAKGRFGGEEHPPLWTTGYQGQLID